MLIISIFLKNLNEVIFLINLINIIIVNVKKKLVKNACINI